MKQSPFDSPLDRGEKAITFGWLPPVKGDRGLMLTFYFATESCNRHIPAALSYFWQVLIHGTLQTNLFFHSESYYRTPDSRPFYRCCERQSRCADVHSAFPLSCTA